jgi:hypothetical protein
MKMKLLFSAVAACGLIAGASYAQSDTSAAPNDTSAGAATAPDNSPAGASGSMSGPSSGMSAQPGAATGAAPATGDVTAAPAAGTNAAAATEAGRNASVNVGPATMAPIPDTKENRARFGGPNSRAGRATRPKGN